MLKAGCHIGKTLFKCCHHMGLQRNKKSGDIEDGTLITIPIKKKEEIPNPKTSITFPLEHCGFINFPSEIWFVQENGLSLSYNNIIFNILITQTIHSSLLYEKKINSLFIPSTGSQYISLF